MKEGAIISMSGEISEIGGFFSKRIKIKYQDTEICIPFNERRKIVSNGDIVSWEKPNFFEVRNLNKNFPVKEGTRVLFHLAPENWISLDQLSIR